MTQTPCPYDGRIRPHPYNLVLPEAEHSRYVGTTHPHLLPPSTSRLDVTRTYSHLRLSVPPSVPHHGELNPPRTTYTAYPFSAAGSEPSDDIPMNCGNLGFPQTTGIYDPWGFYPPPNLPQNATHGISLPTVHRSTLDPTLYPDFPCPQFPWSTPNVQVNPVGEYPPDPSNCYSVFPLHGASPSPEPHLNYTSEPYSGTLDASASYPCLWTEGGVTCNVMVQPTRSHMNRHLHVSHGFGGSDTRQTMCYWVGCGEMMQQGSIARHMVTCHLQAKVTCPMCSKKLSRRDVIFKHQRVCPAATPWR